MSSVEEIKSKNFEYKAILYVSLYGNVYELEEIENYCKNENLLFINDCIPHYLTQRKPLHPMEFLSFIIFLR